MPEDDESTKITDATLAIGDLEHQIYWQCVLLKSKDHDKSDYIDNGSRIKEP